MNYKPLSKRIFLIAFGFYLTACTNNSTVPESEYSTEIIGNWEGTVGELKETMSLNRDSTFICHIRPMGFIANTLSQSLPGTIRGRWQINGAKITMEVTGEKNARVENKTASSTIVTFKNDSLVLKSDIGNISAFRREFKFRKNN